MSVRWEESLGELQQFVADNPSIVIGEVISIPSVIREEFYHKFDAVRDSVLSDILPSSDFDKVRILSQKYNELEKETVHRFKLKRINLDSRLKKFFTDPRSILIEELYHPLFNLLKGKITREAFQKDWPGLQSKFEELYQSGYCKWMALSLLKLFKATSIGAFSMPFSAREQSRGAFTKDKPRLIDVDFVEFDNNKPFVTPDFAAYSPNLKCYMAIKTEIQRSGVKFAYNPVSSEARKWASLDSSLKIFTPCNVFVYLSSNVEDFSLLVNNAVCCPDVIIRCFPMDNSYTEERIQETVALHNALNPHKTYVISDASVTGKIPACDGIHIVNAGLDQSKLVDIVDEMIVPFKLKSPSGENHGAKLRISGWFKWLISAFNQCG